MEQLAIFLSEALMMSGVWYLHDYELRNAGACFACSLALLVLPGISQ